MKKRKILVVDDEPSITRELKLQLEETGRFEVGTANNGADALQLVRNFKPDAAILDVMMPDMDGGELKFQLHQRPGLSHLPVAYLTALSKGEPNDKEMFIEKPINIDRIIEYLDDQLVPAPAATTR